MFIVLSSSLNRWDVFVLKEEVGEIGDGSDGSGDWGLSS